MKGFRGYDPTEKVWERTKGGTVVLGPSASQRGTNQNSQKNRVSNEFQSMCRWPTLGEGY